MSNVIVTVKGGVVDVALPDDYDTRIYFIDWDEYDTGDYTAAAIRSKIDLFTSIQTEDANFARVRDAIVADLKELLDRVDEGDDTEWHSMDWTRVEQS